MDMFKPDDFTADADGKINIKLIEPTHASRPTSSSEKISLTLPDHFFAGWYMGRELVRNENGEVVDEFGNVLVEKDGEYFIETKQENAEGEIETKYDSALPVYSYSQRFDFAEDTIVYDTSTQSFLGFFDASQDKIIAPVATEDEDAPSMTLYAGWVSYFQFNFYFEGENGAWEKHNNVYSFDYKTINADADLSDKDELHLPTWQGCKVEYTYTYQKGSTYTFPQIPGTTFVGAYKDEACTQKIDDVLEHEGTLDLETAKPNGRVQNIYVKVEQGEKYRISTAQELADNPNAIGQYEILNDLDFTDVTWPALFSSNTFKGKMFATQGNEFTISNVTINHNSGSAKRVGLFGELASGAEISDLSFENVTLTLAYMGRNQRNVYVGLFAGNIDDGATLTNVSVSGTMRIGEIALGGGYKMNVYANGNTAGLIKNTAKLVVYGREMVGLTPVQYNFTVDAENVTVTADYMITIQFLTGSNGYKNYSEKEIGTYN